MEKSPVSNSEKITRMEEKQFDAVALELNALAVMQKEGDEYSLKEKEIAERIRSFPKEEFKKFIGTLFFNTTGEFMRPEGIPEIELVQQKGLLFSDDVIRACISKYFSLFENIQNSKGENVAVKRPFSDATRAGDAFESMLMEVFSESGFIVEKDQDTFNERVYRIVIDLAHMYPDQVESVWELFWQTHGEACRMNVILDSMLGLVTDKKLKRFLSRMRGEMHYFFAFKDQSKTQSLVEERLDFENEENFGKTAAMLELLRSFSHIDGYAEDQGAHLVAIRAIQESLKHPGSYLLRMRAQDTLDVLGDEEYDKDSNMPFQISRDQFAFCDESGLRIIDVETAKSKMDAFAAYQEFNTAMREKAQGSEYYRLSPMDVKTMRDLQNRIWGPAGKSVTVEDLTFDPRTIKNENEAIFDFEYLQRDSVRRKIEKDFNMTLSAFSLKEQYAFLDFLKSRNTETFKKTAHTFQIFGNNFIRSFLSGKDEREKISILAEKLPSESASLLFAKYGEVIDAVEDIADVLGESLGEKATPGIIQSAREHLLIRGKNLLVSYADKAEICAARECEDLGRELERKLADVQTSLLLFASSVKALSEKNEFQLEDFKNVALDMTRGVLDDETRKTMIRIFTENRQSYPPELLKDSLAEFESVLARGDTSKTFYVLRVKGDIAAFMRIDEQPDGSAYGASLNVRPELRGSAIGTELLKRIIVKESETRPFRAVCYEKNPMLTRYTSDFGFQIVGTIENYHGTGETFYELERPSGFIKSEALQ